MKKLTSAFICLLLAVPCQARIIYVDVDATGADNGSTWTDAYNYLQDALADANSTGDVNEIWVAQGIYTPDSNSDEPNGSGDREATFQLINGVTIKGGYAGFGQPDPNARDIELYETILSGDLNGNDGPDFANNGENSYHVVTGSGTDETAVLDGLTITGGHGVAQNRYGGGMYNYDGCPTVSNCTFNNNSVSDGFGGGMYNEGASLTLSNCTFSGNSAGDNGAGGGMYNASSSPILTDCAFRSNSSYGGGGMCNDDSNLILNNCMFRENSVIGEGGGMYNRNGSSPELSNCIFNNNSAKTGGGMRNSNSSSPILTNCSFSGNTVEGGPARGGGLYNFDKSNPTLTNCTFVGNSATNDGGGIQNTSNSSPLLVNCLFSGNSASSDGGGMVNVESSPMLINCILTENSARYGAGMYNKHQSSRPTLINCTFSRNSAQDSGGGMFNEFESGPTLTNCILWGNTAPSGAQIYSDGTSSATVSYSDVQGSWPGTGNIDADPCFVAPGYWDSNAVWVDGDYHLLRTSPCIDAANDVNVYTDIEGNPRPFDFPGVDNNGELPDFDMGAYEATAQQARLLILPRVINRKSRQPRIMAWLRLPQGITKDQIDKDVPLILYPGGIKAVRQFVIQNRRRDARRTSVFAFFNKAELMDAVDTNGTVQLQVFGHLLEPGQYFYGSDTIRIIARRPFHRRH